MKTLAQFVPNTTEDTISDGNFIVSVGRRCLGYLRYTRDTGDGG